MRNLKSRGPSSVQAKGFRAKIITILLANVELHRKKNKNKNKNKEERVPAALADTPSVHNHFLSKLSTISISTISYFCTEKKTKLAI